LAFSNSSFALFHAFIESVTAAVQATIAAVAATIPIAMLAPPAVKPSFEPASFLSSSEVAP
jgi:hypothetical protein